MTCSTCSTLAAASAASQEARTAFGFGSAQHLAAVAAMAPLFAGVASRNGRVCGCAAEALVVLR